MGRPARIFADARSRRLVALVVAGLTRAALGSTVRRASDRRERPRSVRRLLHSSRLLTLFVVFLIPGLSDDVICFVGGTTDLDIKRMTVVALVGRIPGYFLANLAGASVATDDYGLAAAIVVALVAVALVVYVRRDELTARLFPPAR